jgi:hypothetical protein
MVEKMWCGGMWFEGIVCVMFRQRDVVEVSRYQNAKNNLMRRKGPEKQTEHRVLVSVLSPGVNTSFPLLTPHYDLASIIFLSEPSIA